MSSVCGGRSVVVLHVVIRCPVSLVPRFHLSLAAPVVVARQERLVAVAIAFKSLQLTGAIYAALVVVSDVERYHSYRVAGYKKLVLFLVIECEGEYTAQLLDEVHTLVAIECKDHLAVAAGLKLVFSGITGAYVAVIVYLAVHGKYLFEVGREQRLSAALRIDNRQSLMTQYGRTATINATPVRSTVSDFLRHVESLSPQCAHISLYIEYSSYSTHDLLFFKISVYVFCSLTSTCYAAHYEARSRSGVACHEHVGGKFRLLRFKESHGKKH